MSKRGYISRYLLLLKKIKVQPYVTYEALAAYIQTQQGYLQFRDEDLNIGFSKRTLQRDLKDIRNLFGIDVQYSPAGKGYYITASEGETGNFSRIMEAYDLFNVFNSAAALSPFVHLEKRQSQGTEHLEPLLQAIKGNLQVQFSYQLFWGPKPLLRTVEPYALKEYQNRWYVIGREAGEAGTKTFALDRLQELQITDQKFEYPQDYRVADAYEHSFGIYSSAGREPAEIILSFEPVQGQYIRTLPLHPSQQIIADTEEELRIRLRLCIAPDFTMKLLSFGDSVKVISPAGLAGEIRKAHQSAAAQYERLKTKK